MDNMFVMIGISFLFLIGLYLLIDHIDYLLRKQDKHISNMEEILDVREKERWHHDKVWPEDNRYTKDQPLTEWERELAEGKDPGRG